MITPQLRFIKRAAAVFLVAVLLLSVCGCSNPAEQKDSSKLSFKEALSYDYLKSLNGQTVTINGYLATSSPVDGSFIFLMNLPYQSCPFCVPNTSQLSNTIEVYPAKGETFTYTNQAVKVTGKLDVAAEDKPFTDLYGYEFSFKIVDAEYTIIKGEELSEKMALWQKFSQTSVINDINAMFDFVNFTCDWPNYYVNSFTDENGDVIPGYYLYAGDAQDSLEADGQYGYGMEEGYFDGLVGKIRAIDPSEFEDLVNIVAKAKSLAEYALSELEAGNYTCEEQYVEQFDTTDFIYTLTNGEDLVNRFETVYYEFSMWLGSWEM